MTSIAHGIIENFYDLLDLKILAHAYSYVQVRIEFEPEPLYVRCQISLATGVAAISTP
jgi:hypothetical protein